MTDPRLLDLVARLEAGLAELRQALASEQLEAVADPAELAGDDGEELETGAAAQRFVLSKEKLQRWCRDYEIGRRVGGRWLVNVAKLRRHLDGKGDRARVSRVSRVSRPSG